MIEAWGMSVYHALLAESERMEGGDFTTIDTRDLERLFAHYDARWFGGALSRLLAHRSPFPLRFRFSRRMTKTAGLTRRTRMGNPPGGVIDAYEISIAIDPLFQSFEADHRTITVNGCICTDRLMALQRIFEHELVHLVEFLLWDESSCRRKRFQRIARDLFGHLESTHRLITRVERARALHGIGVGQRVAFEHQGRRYTGMVNRITKRATVLVEDPRGERYSDGKRYVKFYVPLDRLERCPP